jgi:hypothetical protein
MTESYTPPKLLADILDNLAIDSETRERFNNKVKLYNKDYDKYRCLLMHGNFCNELHFVSFWDDRFGEHYSIFKDCLQDEQQFIIQTALSNTPNGMAICAFLDKEYRNYNNLIQQVPMVHVRSRMVLTDIMKKNGYKVEEEIVQNGVLVQYADVGHLERNEIQNLIPKGLNHLLYNTFNTALFHGKPFKTALEETNAVYLAEIK